MSRKIYGIDLGTTNSVIGYDNELYGPMIPSIAKISEGGAGERYRTDFDTSRSFKVNMSCGVEGKEAVAASALVLKELVKQAREFMKARGEADCEVVDVVIAVPAFFTDNQRQATVKAAQSIGLNVRALINEPTAAAMYYSQNARKLSLVYDLGGGTFDVSVIDSRLGLFDVQSTDGIILGGINFDAALRSYVLKQAQFKIHRMHDKQMEKLKAMCETAKIEIQRTRQDYVMDLSEFGGDVCQSKCRIDVDTYKQLMKLTFKKTITETKKVIHQSIMFGDEYTFLLVGGSTRCPFLREWLSEELGKEPEPLTYNPDLIVAQGACLYAKMLETGVAAEKVSDVTKALSLGLEDGTVRVIIPKDSKIPIEDSIFVTNPTDADTIRLQLYQGDSILAENNELIGTLNYEIGEVKPARTVNLKVGVRVDLDGIIHLKAKEPLKPEKEIVLERD